MTVQAMWQGSERYGRICLLAVSGALLLIAAFPMGAQEDTLTATPSATPCGESSQTNGRQAKYSLTIVAAKRRKIQEAGNHV